MRAEDGVRAMAAQIARSTGVIFDEDLEVTGFTAKTPPHNRGPEGPLVRHRDIEAVQRIIWYSPW